LKKLVIFDLDGVIYLGDEPLPHAAETLKTLRKRGLGVSFLTNNSTRSRKSYSDKLNSMGIEAGEHEIMSSSYATRKYLDSKGALGAKVFIVGESGIRDELESGYTILGPDRREEADFLVVGYDREINYDKLSHALDAVLAGAEFVATNRDPTYPQPGGRILPGGGSIVAAIAAAAQREPVNCGKPDPFGIRFLMDAAGAAPGETLLVGDRADSDMIAGNRAGVDTCLVLTGITTAAEVKTLDGEMKPKYVIENLGELTALLDGSAGGSG